MRVLVQSGPGARAAAWDVLVDAQELPTPFLRSWWVSEAAGGTPAVLLCLDGDELVGGAAFEVDRVGRGPLSVERVRSLGQGTLAPDHLDVIAAPGRGDDVVDRVIGWLRRPGSRLVDLDGLAADGRLARALAADEIGRIGAPWAPLPENAEAYLADRPGQLRSTISRSRKRLVKAGVTSRQVPADGAGPALEALARLHDGRWAGDSGFLDAWDRFERAARRGIASGAVTVHELRTAEDEVIAVELDLVAGDRVAFYQAGRSTDRDWRGAGSVLKADVIGRAVADGRHEYDLLRGDESYKSDWASRRRELVRVRFGVGSVGRPVAAAAAGWVRAAPLVLSARDRVRDRFRPPAASPPGP
jgi:CelD/BcsL family acetyltransferase involved in cellulose biosynthesis